MNLNDKWDCKCENIWLPHFFEMVVACVNSDGGDGDARIISKDFKYLADEFDEWRKDHKWLKDYKRHEGVNHILITDESNENFLFCDESEPETPWKEYVFIINKQQNS